jgi:hypothetical protein
MSTQTNGRIRKSLAEQIDRLDTILDTLAEGLNEAVAGAVTQAVAVAVQAAVVEILTNPTLQQRLRATPKADRPGVSVARRVWAWVKDSCTRLGSGVKKAFAKTVEVAGACKEVVIARAASAGKAVKRALKAGWSRTLKVVAAARHMRQALVLALVAGLTIGVACYFSGPAVSSLISGVTGFISAMAAGTWKALANLLAGEHPRST